MENDDYIVFIDPIAKLNELYELLDEEKKEHKEDRKELIRLNQSLWAKFNNMPLPWYLKDKIFNNLGPIHQNLYYEWIDNITHIEDRIDFYPKKIKAIKEKIESLKEEKKKYLEKKRKREKEDEEFWKKYNETKYNDDDCDSDYDKYFK